METKNERVLPPAPIPSGQTRQQTNENNPKPKLKEKAKAREHRAKETAIGIARKAGYEELNEKEKELCITLTIQPNTYLDLKKKLIKKAGKNSNLQRGVVVKLIEKDFPKDKAFAIFDFLKLHSIIPSDD